jgi:Endodeoxyribonuclease RusA
MFVLPRHWIGILLLLITDDTDSFQAMSWNKNRGFQADKGVRLADDDSQTTTSPHSLNTAGNNNNNSTAAVEPRRTRKNDSAGRKSKSSSGKSEKDPDFWLNSRDPVFVNQSLVQCIIRGNPQPLRRHRTARRGFMYNPSAAAQRNFQSAVQTCLNLSLPVYANDDKDDLIPVTHFGMDAMIHLTATFYLARPKNHFRSSIPGAGRLKATAPRQIQRQVDIDNLAKFVLDSLNGLLYADDHQVVSLSCTKCYDDDDNDDTTRGKTFLSLQAVSNDEVSQIIWNTIPPVSN